MRPKRLQVGYLLWGELKISKFNLELLGRVKKAPRQHSDLLYYPCA